MGSGAVERRVAGHPDAHWRIVPLATGNRVQWYAPEQADVETFSSDSSADGVQRTASALRRAPADHRPEPIGRAQNFHLCFAAQLLLRPARPGPIAAPGWQPGRAAHRFHCHLRRLHCRWSRLLLLHRHTAAGWGVWDAYCHRSLPAADPRRQRQAGAIPGRGRCGCDPQCRSSPSNWFSGIL